MPRGPDWTGHRERRHPGAPSQGGRELPARIAQGGLSAADEDRERSLVGTGDGEQGANGTEIAGASLYALVGSTFLDLVVTNICPAPATIVAPTDAQVIALGRQAAEGIKAATTTKRSKQSPGRKVETS